MVAVVSSAVFWDGHIYSTFKILFQPKHFVAINVIGVIDFVPCASKKYDNRNNNHKNVCRIKFYSFRKIKTWFFFVCWLRFSLGKLEGQQSESLN